MYYADMDRYFINKPHDKFFKDAMGRKDVARSFIQHYLPHALVKTCDLDTLQIIKDSYIDKELEEHFSDIVHHLSIRSTFLLQTFVRQLPGYNLSIRSRLEPCKNFDP